MTKKKLDYRQGLMIFPDAPPPRLPCFNCGEMGHGAADCPRPNMDDVEGIEGGDDLPDEDDS